MAVEDVPSPDPPIRAAKFRKDPHRWAATPTFRYRLHTELNDKLHQIETEFAESRLNYVVDDGTSDRVGVIASGVVFHTARQVLLELGVRVPLLKIGTPYPLPKGLVDRFMASLRTIVVLEEPDTCIELQLSDRGRVRGRLDGMVPAAGELSPEAVSAVLAKVLTDAGYEVNSPPDDFELHALIESLSLPMRKPRLCPGCPHRSVFFVLKREFGSEAIFPSDIGCYTLGINLGAVDTCVDMGASVGMAIGFCQANRLVGDVRPIVATIGDSTFLHAGLEPLIDAVHTRARFVLIILDNHTTAMTGFQPTAASEILANGDTARKVSVADLVHACGVTFVRVVDPYDYKAFHNATREAYAHSQAPEGGVAVVIAERPCVLYDRSPLRQNPTRVVVTEECDGCGYCVEAFECPALVLRPDKSRMEIDYKICAACGQCIDACYKGFIVPQAMEPASVGL
jgi:indolepyruvate ferredoxin oxidoreductase alpha subunit